jgi:hypothetical protein
MKTSKKLMLGTLFVAATIVWVAGPSLAANDSSHSPSPATNAHGSAPPPSGPKARVKVGNPGRLQGVKPIKIAPATVMPTPTGANNHENNAGCIQGGTGPSQEALCGN